MKPCILRSIYSWQRFFLLLLAGAFIGTAYPVSAATGSRKILDLELSNDHRAAKVKVPKGVANVTIQMFEREGGWRKVLVAKASSGVMNFRLPVIGSKSPAKGKEIRWRALGWYEKADVSHDKFPASFYKGKNSFGTIKDTGSSRSGPMAMNMAGGLAVEDSSTTSSDVPVEADIWKIDGNTVYFFNQLRGLQVLDMANPAEPHMTASLRLPAVGQDLYLLPDSTGGARTVVLLTEGWSDQDGQWTRINVVKVSGGKAEITYSQDVQGSLADSRLSGNRLILATTEWNYSNDENDNWSARSRLSEWLLAPDKAPTADGQIFVEGDSPLISSGTDWLALAVHPSGQWDVSEVSVFAVRPQGLVRMGQPIQTQGSVSNKFAMQWSGNVLSTVSESNSDDSTWSPTSVLENFQVWAPEVAQPSAGGNLLGRVELATGESLFATRFAGNKAYVVTYLQTDPLWVVDLSDPANPVVAGQIEVPGWSSHLEPIGDMLFAIGWESNTVVASLFDVANAADPKLLRRVKLGAAGSYSEALWDEKALKVLPDAGLALIPLNSYDWDSGASTSIVRLLDIDLAARDLRLRGEISHDFDARRADLIGNNVVSISQRVLIDADISDRDAPSVLSEVTLAWPVNRVFAANGYMFQIEDGNWYGGGRATVRVSPADASEEILAETDLGEGTVKAADYRDGKLYILRQIGSSRSIYYWSPVLNSSGVNKLVLDIYDASTPSALALLGSSSFDLSTDGQISGDHLLWPKANRPAVVLDYRYSYWFGWGGPILMDSVTSISAVASPMKTKSIMIADYRPYWVPQKAPRLILYDTSIPEAPEVGEPVMLGLEGSTLTGVSEAADGLIVLGTTRWDNPDTGTWLDYGVAFQSAEVVEVQATGTPIVRPPIELPGKLFAVTELDADGFLAFTRTYNDGDSTTFQVSASDGYEAFLVASLDAPAYAVATAGGRRLFVAKPDGVERHLLGEDGTFTTESPLEIGWTPYSLRWLDGTLIGATWNSLFAADGESDKVDQWNFQSWYLGTDQITLATDGDLLVPFGDYGAERLAR